MPHSPTRYSGITIDTTALSHNLAIIQQRAPHSKVLAMVKANAYGHRIAACLPALAAADGLGVASFAEAYEIRQLGWAKRLVLIEGAFSEMEWQQAVTHRLSCVVHCWPQVTWALTHSAAMSSEPRHPSRTLWLKLNSGMNRLGFDSDEILSAAKQLYQAGYQLILTSHFANADDAKHPLNEQQIATFNSVLAKLHTHVSPTIKASFCNSAALINFPACHYDWVRPGIMLYGSSPIPAVSAHDLMLRPVMAFHAALMAIHDITKDSPVGYGSRYYAPRAMKKGIISAGYGDGYPRVVNESAWVCLHQDHRHYCCPIIGRVAMDMIAIDLSAVSSPKPGSLVTLWGTPPNSECPHPTDTSTIHQEALMPPSVDQVAAWADTIGYELLCQVTNRPERHILASSA